MKFFIFILFSSLAYGQVSINTLKNNNYYSLFDSLKDKRIVLLGEQTHGEGATSDEKVKIIKNLHEKLGYNSIAFESGLYDNYKANQLFLNKDENSSVYNQSIFSIWSDTQSFQDLLVYIDERAKNGDTIKIIGFDCQEGVLFKNYFVDDLKSVFNARKIKLSPLQIEKIEKTFIYKDLDLIASSKTDSLAFGKDVNYVLNTLETMTNLTFHEKMIKQVFKSSLANVQFQIAQIQNQKIIVQNPRDDQMAKNLIFLAETFPNEKIIAWGASYHFAKEISNLVFDEITEDYLTIQSTLEKEATGYSDYKKGDGKTLLEGAIPMGKLLKEYFKEKIYSIAFSSYEGNYGMVNATSYRILTPPENSIEKQLSEFDVVFVEFDKENYNTLYCSALGNMPIKGNWSQSFDALVFIKKSYQPQLRKYDESDFKKIKLSKYIVKGKVRDKKSNLVIENAEIVLISSGKVTPTKKDGSFEFIIPNTKELQFLKVNAFGYASDSLQVSVNKKNYEFKLEKSKLGGIVLDEVVLNKNQKELSAKEIVKKAEKLIKENYYQKAYNQSFHYKHSVVQNQMEGIVDEAIIKFYNPKGLSGSNTSKAKFYGKIEKLKKTPNKVDKFVFSSSHGLYSLLNRDLITEKANALYRNGSYNYTKEGFETIKGKKVYKIYFENTSPGSYSTGFGYPAPKSSEGHIYIDCETFAVLQFEHCLIREPFDLTNDTGQNFAFIHNITVTYKYLNGVCFMDELIDSHKNTITSNKDPNYLNIYFLVYSLKSDSIEVENLEIIKEPVKLNFGSNTPFKEDKAIWENKESIDNIKRTKDEFFCK